MGQPRGSGLVSITAALTSTILITVATGKKATLEKILWTNRSGGPGYLRIGYIDNLGVFQQVLVDILMLGGPAIDGSLVRPIMPLCGNDPDGFILNADPAGGCTGIIYAQSTVAGAAPADVQVQIEIDEV